MSNPSKRCPRGTEGEGARGVKQITGRKELVTGKSLTISHGFSLLVWFCLLAPQSAFGRNNGHMARDNNPLGAIGPTCWGRFESSLAVFLSPGLSRFSSSGPAEPLDSIQPLKKTETSPVVCQRFVNLGRHPRIKKAWYVLETWKL